MGDRNLKIGVIGAGLAGSEAALVLARHEADVKLFEMRPKVKTAVHRSENFAELVCSNSFKSQKEDSAAGMLKNELRYLDSPVFNIALDSSIAAGGALAVDRELFSRSVTSSIGKNPNIEVIRNEVKGIQDAAEGIDALIVATGPLTGDSLAQSLIDLTGSKELHFYDAAAPIVMAESIDMSKVFFQNRYENDSLDSGGDYLNIALTKEEYDSFIDELVKAKRVIAKDFETKELFQACQPIEEIARRGKDALRHGTMKPVGLIDPKTQRRPWAAIQLRREDEFGQSYNLVGFQTNLTFSEQKRIFSKIPGLGNAEFSRFGVMHRNTFLDAPRCLDRWGRLDAEKIRRGSGDEALLEKIGIPIYIAGQLSGTEGYTEAIRSGNHAAIACLCELRLGRKARVVLPRESAFGALMEYATDEDVGNYQPMHVNFGLMVPLENKIKNKQERYRAYAERAEESMRRYVKDLAQAGIKVPNA